MRFYDGRQWTTQTALVPAAAPRATGAGPSDPVHWLLPTGRPWHSIVAGYLGIFALFVWVLAPVALGLGAWSLVESSRKGLHGRGRSTFAVIAGVLGCAFGIAFMAL
jgi:hypothetical protein